MTNPTKPPPHVMEALRHIDWSRISRLQTTHHLRECPTHASVRTASQTRLPLSLGTLSFCERRPHHLRLQSTPIPNWKGSPMFQAIVHVTRTMLQVIRWFALLVVVLMLSMFGATIMALFLDWPAEQLVLVALLFLAISFAYLFWGPRPTGDRRRPSIGSSYHSGSGAAAGLSGAGGAAGGGGGSSCGGGGGVVRALIESICVSHRAAPSSMSCAISAAAFYHAA